MIGIERRLAHKHYELVGDHLRVWKSHLKVDKMADKTAKYRTEIQQVSRLMLSHQTDGQEVVPQAWIEVNNAGLNCLGIYQCSGIIATVVALHKVLNINMLFL